MKAIRLMALGAALALGGSLAGAQAVQPRADTARHGVARDGHRGAHRGFARKALFRGVTLSDAQKQQLETVAAKYKPQREALHAQAQQLRQDGQKPDSATRATFRAKQQALHDQQLADIRAVLTADQRTQFDANVAKMKERAAKHEDKRGARKGQKQRQG